MEQWSRLEALEFSAVLKSEMSMIHLHFPIQNPIHFHPRSCHLVWRFFGDAPDDDLELGVVFFSPLDHHLELEEQALSSC